jgi:hypothetical protein
MKRIFTLLCLFVSTFSFAQVDLNLGLGAYFPFTGNANDASGNNNNPSFNNATLTADHLGIPNSAYHFNGINNYIRIPNSPTLNSTNTLSICAWVRPTGFYTGPCHGNSVIMKGDNDLLPGNYLMRYDDGPYSNFNNCSNPLTIINENFYGGGVAVGAPGYAPYIVPNEWHSVVVTYDGVSARLYVDCVLKATTSQSGATFTNSYDLFLGHLNNPGFPYWLNGDIDEVRIYNRAINQDEVNAYGGCAAIVNCSNWLETHMEGQSVKIGDLDVSGTQMTIEAQFNRTAPYVGTYIYGGDIVSKHGNPSSTNYLLRPNDAEITTTNGYFVTPPVCEIHLFKTYHVALVYNGSTLKFYRNGYLLSQVAATGNLFQNNFLTTIGDWGDYIVGVGSNFQGNINNVRIWNVARTQAQIQSYMNTALPDPASQTGLLAYYTFDNLVNKQGNALWNGTLMGGATINATNPQCAFIFDSCGNNLPVTLKDFNAHVVNNKKIELTWHTEEESNMKDYTIKRSTTGYEPGFAYVGTVSAKNTGGSHAYSFTDNTAKSNTLYYYKLVINDLDGSKKESPTRTAKITNNNFYTLVYPNPTYGMIKVFINNAVSDVQVKVMNNLGQLITKKKAGITNTNPVLLDISHAAKGIYWVIIENEGNKSIEKIIK